MRMKTEKRKHPGSRTMTVLSVFLLAMMVAAILLSNHVIQMCIRNEEAAQENRMELHLLSQELADASDDLTEEVRSFAVTGDICHLYRYWHEVYQDKRRNAVIDTLSGYQLPRAERAFLAEAKAYSDMLIETEAISMKLVLLSRQISDQDHPEDKELTGYIRHVMSYTIPADYQGLDASEMRRQAVTMLYDLHYTETKTLIMTPIRQFQTVLHKRTEEDVRRALQGQHTAENILMICSAAVLLLASLIVFGFNRLYIRPLIAYTNTLRDMGGPGQALRRVKPEGAYELYRFGRIYNQLILMLEHELERRADAERNMRTAKEEADHANQVKGDFLAQMSHELRTPLHTISGYTYLLETTALTERQKQYCRQIAFSSDTLLEIINGILDFSKFEAGGISLEMRSFSLPALLRDTVDMMQSSAVKKHLALQCDLPEDLPEYVISDPGKLRQVLVNLLGNAIKFTSEGHVTLSAETAGIRADRASVRICVSDSGSGIPAEAQRRIFEPFVQGEDGISRTCGGTGLGLPISQSIIRALSHGEQEIGVTSEPGIGSAFYFALDLERGKPPVLPAEPEERAAPAESAVLLVDDNAVNLEMEACILEQYGLRVTAAPSGEAALRLAQAQDFGLVFLDLHMPGMNGFETARKLRLLPRFSTVPIIALTADAIPETTEKIRRSDFNGCLTKPFQPQKLRRLIAEYLHIAVTAPETLLTVSNLLFDEKSCLQKLGGDRERMYRLTEQFWKHHRQDAAYIRAHLESGNGKTADRILHDLVGISGNLCCNRLYHCASALREQLPQYDRETAAQLETVWQETEAALRALSGQHTEIPQAEAGQTLPFDALWEQFFALCQAYDIAAAELFAANRTAFRNALSGQAFQALEDAVAKYDFPWITEHMADREVS